MNAIAIRELRKTYPRTLTGAPFEALKGISLQVAPGEVFGFIGPNGAGKSTAIKILTGAMGSSGGNAELFGIDVADPEARRGLGYVPENASLPDYLTPMEVLRMGLRLHDVKVVDLNSHCMEWLERFDLGKSAHRVIRGFSKGMAQRTALAHALAIKPRLLILDEPLSGLDPMGRRDVVDILSEYSREGGTLFFTSHVLHDVERLAHRYGLIHQGQLRAVQSPAELAGDDEVIVVRSAGKAVIEGLREDAPDRWYADVTRQALWQHLELLKQNGHVLLEVKPVLSLEHAFMRAVGADNNS